MAKQGNLYCAADGGLCLLLPFVWKGLAAAGLWLLQRLHQFRAK